MALRQVHPSLATQLCRPLLELTSLRAVSHTEVESFIIDSHTPEAWVDHTEAKVPSLAAEAASFGIGSMLTYPSFVAVASFATVR